MRFAHEIIDSDEALPHGGAFFVNGGHMVSRREMAAIARRHDTLMSAAMLRALGLAPRRHGNRRERRGRRGGARYRGMMWCFRNHGSPMDRMR